MSRFDEIIEKLRELYHKKNHQYAMENDPEGNFHRGAILTSKLFKETIENKSLAYTMMLMAKQIDGVYEIVGESKKNTVDSLRDKFQDVAVYSIICMILLDEEEVLKAKKVNKVEKVES